MLNANEVTFPSALVTAFGRHRSLAWEMTKRDVLGRYRGASLGLIWSLVTPVAMLIVYTLAFGGVMKAKWPEAAGDATSFALILFAGLIVHAFFSEVFVRAPGLVLNNPNYVTKIIFPLEVLPWPLLFSALFHMAMNFAVLAVFLLLYNGYVYWTILLLPVVLLPFAIMMVGIAWGLSALSVYFRDVSQMTGPIAAAMLFLSSAIVPLDSVPESYRLVFELNPLTFIIDQAREVAIWGRFPDWTGLLSYSAVSLMVAFAGGLFFHKTRRGFADVL